LDIGYPLNVQERRINSAIMPYTTPSTESSFRVRAYKGGAPTTPDSAAGSTAVSPYSPVLTFTTAPYILSSSATVTSRSLSGVPGGLAFNTGNGILAGVCPAPGEHPMTYTLNLSNGGVFTQQFSLRIRPAAGPPVVGTLIPTWNGSASGQRNNALAGTFTDVEAESAVRVSTSLGDMDFILFNNATPATVANFMSYKNAGKYANVAFHQSIPGFVVQTGGFTGTCTGSNFTSAVDQADRTVVTIKDRTAMGGQPARFLRVKVVQN